MLLFVNGEKKNIDRVMQFITEYEQESGQCLNSSKSRFYCHHLVPKARKQLISQITSLQRGYFPFNYLGAPINYKNLKELDCDDLDVKNFQKC